MPIVIGRYSFTGSVHSEVHSVYIVMYLFFPNNFNETYKLYNECISCTLKCVFKKNTKILNISLYRYYGQLPIFFNRF